MIGAPKIWLSRAAAALLAVAGPALGAAPAQARVVGIVYDDSGSMTQGGHIHLPAFGAQLLVSTLNGRNARDRLFTALLSQTIHAFGGRIPPAPGGEAVTSANVKAWMQQARRPLFTEQRIVAPVEQQNTIDVIAREWPRERVATPYEPIEVMLDRLVEEVGEGEEAFLVVISDGDFNLSESEKDGKAIPRFRQSYARHLEALGRKRASLRVDFLLIAPGNPGLVATVEKQGVRPTLLETFNGDATSGRYDVTTLADLTEALKEVIARVSATDRRRQSLYITASADSAMIDSPLSVTRIVAVGTGVEPARPPRVVAHPPGLPPVALTSRMEHADTARGIAGQRLNGHTTQVGFQPALPPGRHEVRFDRAIADGSAFLLFETAAFVELTLLDSKGAEARRDPNSQDFIIAVDEEHLLVARIKDAYGGAIHTVSLGALKGATEFTAMIEGGTGRKVQQLALDKPGNRAAGRLKETSEGVLIIRAQARIEGFVSPPSKPLRVSVVDAIASLELAIRSPASCQPDCPPTGRLRARMTPGGQEQEIGVVELTARAKVPGGAKLSFPGLPRGLVLRDAAGADVSRGLTVPMASQRATTLRVFSRNDPRLLKSGDHLVVEAAAEPPLKGSARGAAVIDAAVPEAKLILTSHSGGGAAERARLTGPALVDRSFAFDLALAGNLAPPQAREFAVSGQGWLLDAAFALRDGKPEVRPGTSMWCFCLLYLLPGERSLIVSWTGEGGIQGASLAIPFHIALTTMDWWNGCFWFVVGLAVLFWLFAWVVAVVRTRRFPRHSAIEVVEKRQLPRPTPLRRGNLRHVGKIVWLFLAWWWHALRGLPHERAAVEGVHVEAEDGGPRLLVRQSVQPFTVKGEDSKQILERQPKLERLKLSWGDTIEVSGIELQLKEDMRK